MAEIRWTEEALTWLHDIYDYIALDDPSKAGKVIQSVYERTQILKQFSEIGYLYRKESEGPIRILLYGHYRIAYLVRANDLIDILGVFHGALDIDKYLPR